MALRSRHRWTACPAALLPFIAALLTACAGDGETLGEALDPDADKRITQQDKVTVQVVANPGTDTGTLDLDRLARKIRTRIDRLKASTPSPRPPRRFDLAVTISRYDAGQAAEPGGSGQTHIDGWRLLTDPDIIARAHRYRNRVADRDTFAWGRQYASPTPIETIEGDFADTLAADLFEP